MPKKRTTRRRGMTPYEKVMDWTERDGECLVFTGHTGPDGYGTVRTDGKQQLAHRVVAEHHLGPSGLHVLHSCDNPACVRVEHLRYGTDKENRSDAVSRGRDVHGESHRNARLSEADVRAIRADTRPAPVVAAEFGIGRVHVYRIRRRVAWKHVA